MRSSLPAIEGEQIANFDFQHFREFFETRDRWRVHPALHETDELDGTIHRLRKLLLREFSRPAQAGDALTELFLKHAV